MQHDIDEDIKFHETQLPMDEDETDGDQAVSQWTTNPLILTHPVHYDPSGSKDLTEPKDPSGANPLTDNNWGIAFEDLGKEDEDKEDDESKSPINKKKNKKNKK